MRFVIYNSATGEILGKLTCSDNQAQYQGINKLEISQEEFDQPLEQTKKIDLATMNLIPK
jgi:hypothetical protein